MAAHPRLAPAFGPAFGAGVTGAATSTVAAVSRRFVVVDGAGPLASRWPRLLRAAGVGLVRAGAWAADTADAELRWGGSTGPDLLVLLADRSIDPRRAEPWRRRGVPLLPVVVDPGPRGRRAVGRRRPGAAVSGLPPPHAHRPRPRGLRCRAPAAADGHARRAVGQHGCRPGGDGRHGRSRRHRDPRGGVGRGRWAVAAGGAPPMGPAYRVPEPRRARPRGRPAAPGRCLAYRTTRGSRAGSGRPPRAVSEEEPQRGSDRHCSSTTVTAAVLVEGTRNEPALAAAYEEAARRRPWRASRAGRPRRRRGVSLARPRRLRDGRSIGYDIAVLERGWEPDHLERWWVESLAEQVLA